VAVAMAVFPETQRCAVATSTAMHASCFPLATSCHSMPMKTPLISEVRSCSHVCHVNPATQHLH
jgi:hypothetical protein